MSKTKKVLDIAIVIIVFGLAGSSTAYLSKIIMHALGAEPWTFYYVAGYILFIFPLYQSLVLIYAALFGRFNYFFNRQKKIARKIKGLFTRQGKEATAND